MSKTKTSKAKTSKAKTINAGRSTIKDETALLPEQLDDVLYFDVPVQLTRLSKTPGDDGSLDKDEDEGDNEDDRYTAVLMTQTVIPKHFRMADGEWVDEVLLTDGAHFPASKRVPLNDSHDESTIDKTVGFVDGLRKDGLDMLGDVFVSAARPDVRTKVKEGVVDSLSLGMKPRPGGSKFIGKDKSRAYGAYIVNGPAVVYTDFDVRHVALTSAPSVQQAKIRLSLLNTLVPYDEATIPLGDPMDEVIKENEPQPQDNKTFAETPDVKAMVKEALETHKKYTADVRTECKQFNLPSDVADEISGKYDNINDARKALLETLYARQKDSSPTPSVNVISEGNDRRLAAQKDAFTYTLMKTIPFEKSDTFENNAPKNVDASMLGMGLAAHTRYMLVEGQHNRQAQYWSDSRCVGFAMEQMRTFAESPYITSGSLSNLLMDAINKIGLAGYQDAIVSYDQVFRQLNSQNNLKDAYAIRLSGLGFMDVWIEGTRPLQKGLKDTKQALKMIPWSNDVLIPWHVLRNDDLGMLSDVPLQMGRAARRTVNRECWFCISGNQVLDEDDNVLFSASPHGNDVTANPGVVSSSEINGMQELMSAQTDLDGSLIGLTGRFLVGPPGQERSIKQACGSVYDPNASVAMIPNIYQSQLSPVIEPLLGQSSQSVYYMFADKASAPVAYCFLTDEETPIINSFIDQHDDSLHVKGRQTFAVAAYDYRRAVRHE